MKKCLIITFLVIGLWSNAQPVTVSGVASDTTNGTNVIEIVINDTLSKIMKDPKKGRSQYLKLYQNPRFVVRTDSTGIFRIKADLKDSLYFKSYNHIAKAYRVADLMRYSTIKIMLERDNSLKESER